MEPAPCCNRLLELLTIFSNVAFFFAKVADFGCRFPFRGNLIVPDMGKSGYPVFEVVVICGFKNDNPLVGGVGRSVNYQWFDRRNFPNALKSIQESFRDLLLFTQWDVS